MQSLWVTFEVRDERGVKYGIKEELVSTSEHGVIVVRNPENVDAWVGKGDSTIEAMTNYLEHRFGVDVHYQETV